MIEQRQATKNSLRSDTSLGHRLLEVLGIVAFGMHAFLIGDDVYRGVASFDYSWLLPILALLAYLVADLVPGFVHFLADNFVSTDTLIIGPEFIEPFRNHLPILKGSCDTASSIPTATTAW